MQSVLGLVCVSCMANSELVRAERQLFPIDNTTSVLSIWCLHCDGRCDVMVWRARMGWGAVDPQPAGTGGITSPEDAHSPITAPSTPPMKPDSSAHLLYCSPSPEPRQQCLLISDPVLPYHTRSCLKSAVGAESSQGSGKQAPLLQLHCCCLSGGQCLLRTSPVFLAAPLHDSSVTTQ